MRKGLVLLIMLFIIIRISAQTIISGTIVDKTSHQPIEFASVLLIHLPDSAAGKGVASDKKGRFSIEGVKPGTYLLLCSFIGFEKKRTASFNITGNTKYNAGQIELIGSNTTLTSVTVTGTRPTLNTSIDRKVYNVEQDIMSKSGSVSDILKNIPSVEVDIDGNVSLRGSGDVVILIDGKPSPLMGALRAEILQQLPANSIQRIEVITNPSAKYRPDGTSGIINIVTKKNIKNGFNGSAIGNAGNHDRYNGNITLNYHPKKFNIFAGYSLRKDTRKRLNTIDRTYLDSITGSTKSYYNQDNTSIAHPLSNIVNGGIDYTIDKRNSVGISGTYNYRSQTRNEVTHNSNYNGQHIFIENDDRLRHDPGYESHRSAVGYFQHQFLKEGNEIRLQFNTSKEDEVDNSAYTNIYYFPKRPTSFDNTNTKQIQSENQLSLDYSNQLSEDAKLEAGYDGLYNKIDANLYGEYFDTTQNQFVKDVLKSNRFVYKEDIHALYVTYQKSYKKFGYLAGLRGEESLIHGRLVTKDSLISNTYFKIYPTLHLSYKLKENSELQLNYSKRVHRPEQEALNPFPQYQDPRNLRAGNPKLLPEITHSFELGYKWENKHFSFVPSLYYRYKLNGFTSVVVPLNDTTLLTTTQNLSNDQSAGLEFVFSAKGGKWFSANLSSNVFYNKIDATNLGYIQNKSIYSMSANLISNFIITKTTMFQISTNYRSARLTPQGKTFPTFVMNMGMRKDLFKNKVSITLTASDLFNSLKQKTELNTPYLHQVTISKRDGLIVYLGINYRFGVVKKGKEEKLQFDNNL
jgi:outer membrane receptor protein involved in Fe transport